MYELVDLIKKNDDYLNGFDVVFFRWYLQFILQS